MLEKSVPKIARHHVCTFTFFPDHANNKLSLGVVLKLVHLH